MPPKLTIEDCHLLAAARGMERSGQPGLFLSAEYKTSQDKYLWGCTSHDTSFWAKQNIVFNGGWCPECREVKPLTLERLRLDAEAIGIRCISTECKRSGRAKHQYRCAQGHEFWAVSDNIKHGHGCLLCFRASQRRYTDTERKIARNLRSRLTHAIRYQINTEPAVQAGLAVRYNMKVGSSVRDLGISISGFKQYLENRWKPGMNWNNYGEWHIDHIRPLASFDLTDRAQFLQAVHYTNLQPLWKLENTAKGARWERAA